MKKTMGRKTLSILITLAMIISFLGGITISASATSTVWDGTSATSFAGGAGTSGDPYRISTAEQLSYLADEVNGGNSYSGYYFKLTEHIFLNSDSTPQVNTWPAIGKQGDPFEGNFDGDGHLVCNLYVFDTGAATHKALFGSTGPEALIENLGVTGTVGAYRFAAGIVGYNEGTITHCFNDADITGNDSGTRGSGGIAGVNTGTITCSYNTGTIHNLYRPVGGIAGIAASTDALIKNCYNVGTVTSAGGPSWAGAILATLNGSTVTNCYYLQGSAAHAVAYPSSTAGEMTGEEMQDPDFLDIICNDCICDDCGNCFMADTYGFNDGYPILTWETYTSRPTSPSAPVSYTVEFTTIGVAPISDIITTDGSVSFTISPTVTPAVKSVTVPADSGATVTKTSTNNYTISNITSDLTVTVNASTSTSYPISSAVSGIIDVLTEDAVTITGDSYENQNLLIDCTAQDESDLTIDDLVVTNTQTSIIDFAGENNSLTISGENLLEDTEANNAAIHVPSDGELTIGGEGTLYLYKDSLAAGIGGDYQEVNGEITFEGGNYFLKGTAAGAVIGTGYDVTRGTPGDISFGGVQANIVTVSNGAAIGGGLDGAIGTIYIDDSSINIVCDWNGAAIGVGDDAAVDGVVYIDSGDSSLYTSETDNRESTTPLVTANVYRTGTAINLYEADIPNVASGAYTVQVDSSNYSTGTTNTYYYRDLDPAPADVTENWAADTTGTVGVWMSGNSHTVSAGGTVYTAIYNPAWGRYSVGVPVTLGPSGAETTLSDALDAANPGGIISVIGTTAIGSGELIQDYKKLIVNNTSPAADMFTIGSGASLEISRAAIVNATTDNTFVVDGGTLTISPEGPVSIAGTIYLASGSYINVGAALANITGSLTVEMATTSVGTTVAQLAGSYTTFAANDRDKFTYNGGGHTFRLYPIVGTPKTQIQIAS